MAIPSKKASDVDQFITETFGIDRKICITYDTCTFCAKEATEFKDELSKKEFSISGLCQICQDEVFGE